MRDRPRVQNPVCDRLRRPDAGGRTVSDLESNILRIAGKQRTTLDLEYENDTPLFETTQDAKIGGNLVVVGQTNSNGGYYGTDGGAAQMQGGLHITNDFTVNGKNVSDSHTHTSNAPGAPTSGVN